MSVMISWLIVILQVWELTANKVIMVSAIGNDGPLYGSVFFIFTIYLFYEWAHMNAFLSVMYV